MCSVADIALMVKTALYFIAVHFNTFLAVGKISVLKLCNYQSSEFSLHPFSANHCKCKLF